MKIVSAFETAINEKGMSISQLAEKIGATESFMWAIVKGYAVPSRVIRNDIQRVLGV